ncbi:FeoA domain-containing protein [Thiospirillum jenense]|uniref:Ferrous iron transport protein A n=1 Tax=Thiospirillum jenense TaxID=1653858 RepID=A0A839H965_9GAMM|nr:FeoA domain-containing protein [Thiospirillum jenense]MBB1125873.1 ferrous iron transport protein A [Thiospirillum jenense]
MTQPTIELNSLTELPLGTTARIVRIAGGRDLNRRLLGLGLHIGSEIRIEHRRGRGFVVAAGETRIALGGGIVEKLLVTPLENTVVAEVE